MTEKDFQKLLESWDSFELVLHHLDANPSFLQSFINYALYNEHRNSWRALYIIDKLYDKHPDWIEPYVPEMIERLKTETHHGKKRHLLKLISQNKIHIENSGFLIDYCLRVFTSSGEPVANRVHAMQVLYNISEEEPDLKPELLEIIQQEIEFHPTPGIRSRGTKLAKKLFQQINNPQS
ncbi:MAG TPA: hypothetical protein PK335_13300 [Draconibacterium sp.]|nr:hypothetical protein [Draconibacterium sp.]